MTCENQIIVPLADQSEAEAGTSNNKAMTPLRVKQAIDAQATSQDVLASESGASMIGYKLPITEALARMAQGKLAENVSVFDFLPYAKHSQILARTNTDDLSDWINEGILQNPECNGIRLFVPPGLYNFEQPLVCEQHISMYGAMGRETMDNSADASGDTGTRWRYRGNSGHLLSLMAPDADNHRTVVSIRDMMLVHNRLLDNGYENTNAVDGCALYLKGGLLPSQGTRQLRFLIDNVMAAQAIDHNILIEGNTYGSEIGYVHLHRAGKNGLRSLYGPAAGETRMGMVRAFQNGWNGTNDLDRAGVAISAALAEIGQLSSSEARGPGVMFGGIVNVGSLQIESCGLDVLPTDRKQIIFGWEENGLLSANIQSFLMDAGDAYEGAYIHHSRYAANVRMRGYFSNTLGSVGRHVELQAPSGPNACGEIDIRETNASVFLDQGGGYNVKSGIEVRLRHGAQISLTGNDETAAFQPLELYDPRGCWSNHRFTAPHNLILDPSLVLSLSGLDKANHDRMRVYTFVNGSLYRTTPFDPSSYVRAGATLATFPVGLPSIPLDQGDYVEFKYDVTGGATSVGLVPHESYLTLTTLPG